MKKEYSFNLFLIVFFLTIFYFRYPCIKLIITHLNSDKKLTHYLRSNNLPMESFLSSQFFKATEKKENLVIGGSSFSEHLPFYELLYKNIYINLDQVLRIDIGLFDMRSENEVISNRAGKNILIFYQPYEFKISDKVKNLGYQSSAANLENVWRVLNYSLMDRSLFKTSFYPDILKGNILSFIYRSTIIDSFFYSIFKSDIVFFLEGRHQKINFSDLSTISLDPDTDHKGIEIGSITINSYEEIYYSLRSFSEYVEELVNNYSVYMIELEIAEECTNEEYRMLRKIIGAELKKIKSSRFRHIRKEELPGPDGIPFRDCAHLHLMAPLTLKKMQFVEDYFEKLHQYIPDLKINFIYKKLE